MKKNYLIHDDSLEIFDWLSDEQIGKLFRKIRDYHKQEWYDSHDPVVDICYITFKNQFDRDEKKYKKKCQKNRENVDKRRNTKQYERIQSNTIEYKRIQSDTNYTDKDKDRDKDRDRDRDKDKDKDKDINETIVKEIKETSGEVTDYIPSVKKFTAQAYKNKKSMRTIIDKVGSEKYIQDQYAEYRKLERKWYDWKTIDYVLEWIENDSFWKKNIMSIKKLNKKNKDWFLYIDMIIDKAKEDQEKSSFYIFE